MAGTLDTIRTRLAELGLNTDDVVLVHSDLRIPDNARDLVRLLVTKQARRPIGSKRSTGPGDGCGDPQRSFQNIADG